MKRAIFFFLMILLIITPIEYASANSPGNTYVWGPDYFVTSQPAYEPITELRLPIKGPEDLYMDVNGEMYIADRGNKRIVKVVGTEIVAEYGVGILSGPTGITLDDAGNMYIADADSNTIVILDKDGSLITQFGKPDEPLFGKNTEFLPRKITVDKRGNIFIVSEGSLNGLFQMNSQGDFIGFFAANKAEMTLRMILQRIFLTEEQLSQFIKNAAPPPTNLALDDQNLMYTISAGASEYKVIRKFNIAGKNIFNDTWASKTVRDIDVSADGIVLTIDSDGWITEYDTSGSILFAMQLKEDGTQRLGLIQNPTAVKRFEDKLYVLDKDKNALIIYQETTFAALVHQGVALYRKGLYQDAKPYFEEVLDFNGSFILSYRAIANAYYQNEEYEKAQDYYRFSNSRGGYSDSFWEIRNDVIQDYLGNALIGFLIAWVSIRGLRLINRRTKFTDKFTPLKEKILSNKWVDDFLFLFRFIRHPMDSFYYIKSKQRGSIRFAILIYVLIVGIRLFSLVGTSFIFNPYTEIQNIPIVNEILFVVILIFLWNISNYLISTINDGEGKVRDVVIGTAYSLFPYVLFMVPITLLSNVFTYNEIFIYDLLNQIIIGWIFLMFFFMVREIHNYTIPETIRNILLTLFTMAIFVLTAYILYSLFNQLSEFILSIFQEVMLRV